MHNCSLDPMIAMRGLQIFTLQQTISQLKLHSTLYMYIPVFGVLEFAYDLGELGVCSGGVDYLGYVALPT